MMQPNAELARLVAYLVGEYGHGLPGVVLDEAENEARVRQVNAAHITCADWDHAVGRLTSRYIARELSWEAEA